MRAPDLVFQRVGVAGAEDAQPGAEHVPAQLVGLAEPAAQGGQPGQGLPGGQRVGVIVAQGLPAAAEDLVHLGAQLLGDRRMPGQQVTGPGQAGRGGLVAGHEHGEDLVPHLPVAHRLAGLVAPRIDGADVDKSIQTSCDAGDMSHSLPPW